jgi:hypothetical protein
MKQIKMTDDFTYALDASSDRTLPQGCDFVVSNAVADEAVAAGCAVILSQDDSEEAEAAAADATAAATPVAAAPAPAKTKAAKSEDAPVA